MKKIRIEVSSLASKNLTGVANYTKMLCNNLANEEETLVYGSYFNLLRRQVEPDISKNIIKEENTSFPLRLYAKFNSLGFVWPFDIFKKHVDLTIHPNFALWPTIKSKKTATVVHDLTYMYYPELVEEKNLSHLQRVVPKAVKKSDFIITVSEAVRDEIIKEFNIDKNKCIVTTIPPAQEFYNRSDINVHKIYNIPTKKYLLFIGSLEPRKNLYNLVKAYRLLPEDLRAEYSLIIGGGKGWKFEETQSLIDKSIEKEHIYQIGYVDQSHLPALYQNASLFTMLSKYEGFGMPVLESLASKCPVVASNIPVMRESGGDAALYADPNNPDDIAEKIIQGLDEGYKDSITKKHLKRFSWQDNVKSIIENI